MMWIQIILVFFAVLAILRTISRFRAQMLPLWSLAGWVLVWLGVIGLAVMPNLASQAAKLVGVGRGADLVVYLALFLLFYLTFKQFSTIKKMEREITTLTRFLAIKESDKK